MQQDMDSRNQAGQTSSVSNSCSSEVPASRDCSEVVEEKRKKETSDRLLASVPKREEQSDIISTVVRFLETHTAYDALPASGKVSVFNSNMPICLAFECLRSQEVAEAIIWNHEKNCYIGIFNSSDLIKAVLMQINMHRHNPQSVDDILLININTYREFQLKQSKNSERLLDCQPTTSLMDILRIMSQYRIRRLPVIQDDQALGILTYSTILYYLVSSFDKSSPIYKQTLRELHLGVYKDVISCPSSTPIAQALFMLESKNISSILVTNDEGRMTTIFQRSDIFKLDIMDISLFEKPLYAIPALVVAVAGRDP